MQKEHPPEVKAQFEKMRQEREQRMAALPQIRLSGEKHYAGCLLLPMVTQANVGILPPSYWVCTTAVALDLILQIYVA